MPELKLNKSPHIQQSNEQTLLTERQVFIFFLPLAASWLLMALESPSTTWFIARLPDTAVSLAALNLFMTISFWIETPVIGLLATATALGVNNQSLRLLKRFTLLIMLLVTVVGAIIALTPIYHPIAKLLDAPPEVAEAARYGLIVMIPWSAAIAWRRFTQGILIRHGQTRAVGYGTIIRLVAIIAIGSVMLHDGRFSGVVVGASALVAGVFAESLFVHYLARPLMKYIKADTTNNEFPPLTYNAIIKFHFPLSVSNMLWLIARPIAFWGLAKSTNPVLTLAAWEAASQLLFLFRSPGMALPEAVIALQKNLQTQNVLMRFCFKTGLVTSSVLLLLMLTPVSSWIYNDLLQVPRDVASLAIIGLIAAAFIPFLGALQSFFKGQLSAARQTNALMMSMFVYLAVTIALVLGLVFSKQVNIVTMTLAITLALLTELLVLNYFWRKHKKATEVVI